MRIVLVCLLVVILSFAARNSLAAGPTISSLSPASGAVGASVVIAGSNFGNTQSNVTVKFNGTTATITAFTSSRITTTVPTGATTGNVTLTVSGAVSNGKSFTVLATPTISSLSPNPATVGTSVTISGSNFGTTVGTVKFNGTSSAPSSWTATAIKAPVPSDATTGNVVVHTSGVNTNGVSLTIVGPNITSSISPTPNAKGWNDGNVVITYTCTPGAAPLTASGCPQPQTIVSEGVNQQFVATVSDTAGNIASVTTTLNVDKTPPSVALNPPVDGAIVTSSNLGLNGTAADALSGVPSATCNGTSVNIRGGAFSCNISLTPGVNLVVVRATDVAGNAAVSISHVTLTATLPAPTGLQVAPSGVNMLVGQSQQFAVIDQAGRPRSDATWSVDNTSVATLATSPPSLLTAVASGTVNLTATVGSQSAHTSVTVLSASNFAPGTVQWSAPAVAGFTTQQIVQAVPTGGSTPDLYNVAVDGSRSNILLQGFMADGQQLWQQTIASASLAEAVADGSGGVLVHYSPLPITAVPTERRIDLDGSTGSIVWDSNFAAGQNFGGGGSNPWVSFGPPAIRQDGDVVSVRTVYTQPTPNVANYNAFSSLIVSRGDSNQAIATTSLPSSVWTSTFPSCPSMNTTMINAPNTSTPVIDGDGSVFLLYSVKMTDSVITGGCSGEPQTTVSSTLNLLKVSSDGTVSTQTVETLGVPGPIATIPDGQGGALLLWWRTESNQSVVKFTQVSGQTIATFDPSLKPPVTDQDLAAFQMVLGENGTAFLTDGASLISRNINSQQINWTYTAPSSTTFSIVAATSGGGVAINNSQQGIFQLDASGIATQVTSGVVAQPEYSWRAGWYVAAIAGSTPSQIALPILVDEASLWAAPSGNASASDSVATLCDCLVETTNPAPPPPPATCPLCNLSRPAPTDPPNCQSLATGTLSRYLILAGDPSTDENGSNNVGNLFNLSAQTEANNLQSQGHTVIGCRVSSVQNFAQALTASGTIDGGVEFFGHAGWLPRTDIPQQSYYNLLSVGQQTGDTANLSYKNVNQLSNLNLGPSATISILACHAGTTLKDFSPQVPAIAQLIANQLRRNVSAYEVGLYFNQNPNDGHIGGKGQPNPPNNLPMYMVPEGKTPKPTPILFVPK